MYETTHGEIGDALNTSVVLPIRSIQHEANPFTRCKFGVTNVCKSSNLKSILSVVLYYWIVHL